jgi:hypothetical protein
LLDDTNHKAQIEAKRAEIKREYDRRKRKRIGRSNPFKMAYLRVGELTRFFTHQYAQHGFQLPEDDAGLDDLAITIDHLVKKPGDPHHWVTNWASVWAPWATETQLRELTERALAHPKCWRADELARALGLRYAVRTLLGIGTIGSIDKNRDQRAEARRERSRQKKEKGRRDKGAKPRAVYLESRSISRLKPWKLEGVSRSTWYRKKSAALNQAVE